MQCPVGSRSRQKPHDILIMIKSAHRLRDISDEPHRMSIHFAALPMSHDEVFKLTSAFG
jgi:hypothetical protein